MWYLGAWLSGILVLLVGCSWTAASAACVQSSPEKASLELGVLVYYTHILSTFHALSALGLELTTLCTISPVLNTLSYCRPSFILFLCLNLLLSGNKNTALIVLTSLWQKQNETQMSDYFSLRSGFYWRRTCKNAVRVSCNKPPYESRVVADNETIQSKCGWSKHFHPSVVHSSPQKPVQLQKSALHWEEFW